MTPMSLSNANPIVYARVEERRSWGRLPQYNITEDKQQVSTEFIMSYLAELNRYEKMTRKRKKGHAKL